jgi:hypothetical protein
MKEARALHGRTRGIRCRDMESFMNPLTWFGDMGDGKVLEAGHLASGNPLTSARRR